MNTSLKMYFYFLMNISDNSRLVSSFKFYTSSEKQLFVSGSLTDFKNKETIDSSVNWVLSETRNASV